MTSADQLGMVEEEVTTEIIKTEITTDEHSQQFFIKNEAVEYEDGVDMKKVFVTKVRFHSEKWNKCQMYTLLWCYWHIQTNSLNLL